MIVIGLPLNIQEKLQKDQMKSMDKLYEEFTKMDSPKIINNQKKSMNSLPEKININFKNV